MSFQTLFELLSAQNTIECLLHLTSKFNELGRNTDKLLAHQLQQMSASSLIPWAETGAGVKSDLLDIKKTFFELYKQLYFCYCAKVSAAYGSSY